MAKFQNKYKRGANGQKVYEAPVEWVELLRQAVEEPGIISKAYSLFHSYSFGNQLMALAQLGARKLAPGPLASYGRWQELGRQVRKDETALVMLVPRTWKRTAVNTAGEEEERVTKYFRFAPTAFTYAQTDPLEGKEDRSGELTAAPVDWDAKRALKALEIQEVPYTDLDGNRQGYSYPRLRRFAINPMAEYPNKTRMHEIAHVLLHADEEGMAEHRGIREFEAECTAFILSTVLGFGGGDESRGYCQHWLAQAGEEDVTERVVSRVMATVQKILVAGRPAVEKSDEQGEQAAA